MRSLFCFATVGILALATKGYAQDLKKEPTTKAMFMVKGLHCAPCAAPAPNGEAFMSALAFVSPAALAPAAYPRLFEIEHTAARLAGHILQTPVWRWQTGVVTEALSPQTEVWLKLELFQRTGSFKLRGALNSVNALDDAARRRGVVAASAGNHAVSVAFAARAAGVHAKLAMPRHASPVRLAACRAEGAELLLTDTVHQAFALAQQLVADEGRSMIHPFDGPRTAEGTATIGLELMRQVRGLDAVVVPVGGGGLCGGISAPG